MSSISSMTSNFIDFFFNFISDGLAHLHVLHPLNIQHFTHVLHLFLQLLLTLKELSFNGFNFSHYLIVFALLVTQNVFEIIILFFQKEINAVFSVLQFFIYGFLRYFHPSHDEVELGLQNLLHLPFIEFWFHLFLFSCKDLLKRIFVFIRNVAIVWIKLGLFIIIIISVDFAHWCIRWNFPGSRHLFTRSLNQWRYWLGTLTELELLLFHLVSFNRICYFLIT